MIQELEQFSPGDPLILQNEPVGFAWHIEQGNVEWRENGVKIGQVTAGQTIGGDILINNGRASADAIAVGPVIASRITREAVQKVHQQMMAQQQDEGSSEDASSDGTASQFADAPATPSSSSQQSSSVSAQPMSGDGLGMLAQAIQSQTEFMKRHMAAQEIELDIIEKERHILTSDFISKMADLGAITPLMEDETINDILINGHRSVFIERFGKLEKTDIQLTSEDEVLEIAKRIAAGINREINPYRPLLDARLADGSRVNIICPPLAVDGTSISIRKFSKRLITLDDMVGQQNVSQSLGEFLKVVGKCRMNVLISGGTGSGKTTLLNAVSQFIGREERIVTIEDAAELKLDHPDLVRLETRPGTSKAHPEMEVTMRDLVKNSLRMRPDRIIVGEVRGHEAFDMMQAMNTGHEGSLTTVHANHPRDALSRLENMIGMANLHIPVAAMRYQIAAALHLIVQVSRQRDGHRRITHVTEIIGMEGDTITMNDLFNFKPKGEDENGNIIGEFAWSGIMPRCTRRIAYYNELPRLEQALGVKVPMKNL